MDYDALRYALEGDGIFRLGECFGFIFGIFTFLLLFLDFNMLIC